MQQNNNYAYKRYAFHYISDTRLSVRILLYRIQGVPDSILGSETNKPD
jgi:hypothetical protein